MDISKIRERFEHKSAKTLLKEKYKAKMMFAYNGGMWRAGPELLMTIAVCPNQSAVLVDEYENPIQVDTAELKELAQQCWQEQMNAWQIEYTEINTKR